MRVCENCGTVVEWEDPQNDDACEMCEAPIGEAYDDLGDEEQ